MSNPYADYRRYQADQEPPPIAGREALLTEMLNTLTDNYPRSIQLVAFRTMGRTTVLRYLAHPKGAMAQPPLTARLPTSRRPLFLYLDFNRFPDGIGIADWLSQHMSQHPALQPFIPEEPPLNLIVGLKRTILNAGDAGWRIVFVCDHFDRIFSQLKVSEATELRPLVDLASFVTATEKPLVQIKPDAASSLFGSKIHPIDLLPLAYRDALALLQQAAASLPSDERAREAQMDYHALLKLTGTIPHYVLRGAELWYNARQQYQPLNGLSTTELLEILRPTLLQDFALEFVRFWNHITPEQRSCLHDLVTKSMSPAQMTLPYKQRIKWLLDRGLVIADGRYQPMSGLWAEFIRQKKHEEETAKEVTAVTDPAAKDHPSPREAELLRYLQQHTDQICTYQMILADVWRSDDSDENRHTLRQVVAQLRRWLQTSNQGMIINHRNKGYEFRP